MRSLDITSCISSGGHKIGPVCVPQLADKHVGPTISTVIILRNGVSHPVQVKAKLECKIMSWTITVKGGMGAASPPRCSR